MRDIAYKAKVSLGLIYFYYDNKKDILKAIFMKLKPVFSELHQKCSDKLSFTEYFNLLGNRIIDYSVSNSGFNLLLINEGIKDPELSVFFYEQLKNDISTIARKFSEYACKESLRKVDFEKTAISIIAAAHTLATFKSVFKDNFDFDLLTGIMNYITDVNINGLVLKNRH